MATVRNNAAEVDPDRPAPARVYDYLLGGHNHFESDRAAAGCVMTLVPEINDCAWSNRGFHQRAARWIAERGVHQFIDVGSGLPTVGNTHEVVQGVHPGCRVVYADNDPMAVAHARQLLTSPATVRVVHADLSDPGSVLDHPATKALIDFGQPVGLLMTAVVHFVIDDAGPLGPGRPICGRGRAR